MDWNRSAFEFIKRFPNNYPIVYNDIQYTIKPSIHGIGLFANQDIPANTSLGYLVPLSSNMYPFYLKNHCENVVNGMEAPKRQSIQQRFQQYYQSNFDTIASQIEQQAKRYHLERLGSNYYFMTNMHSTLGILNATGNLPDIRYSILLLDTTETPFAFSNSSRNKRGVNDQNVENVQVDYDASVKTIKDIYVGNELRWAYDWS